MSDQDVIDHVHRYAKWLEATSSLDLSPPGDPAELTITETAHTESASTSRWLAIAAAIVLCLGAAWVFNPGSSEVELVLASGPAASAELYVLPDPFDPNVVRNAYVRFAQPGSAELGTQIVTVGVRSGDGYTDLAIVREGPTFEGLGTPTDVELASGPAQLYSDVFTSISQQRGQTTLTVTTQQDRTDYAGSVLDRIEIAEDGSLRVASDADFEIIAAISLDADFVDFSSSFGVNAPELTNDGETISVETAASSSPLIGVGFLGGYLSATRFQGVDGWVVTRQDGEGEWNAIAWQATPSAIVAVSGHAPLEAIVQVAESLIIVDDTTWQAAFPNYQGE